MPDTRKSFLENAPGPTDPCGALYVHVPVCQRRCRYCDFFSIVADQGLSTRIVDGLVGELGQRRRSGLRPLATAFVGGGTPTALAGPQLSRLLGAIAEHCDVHTEFTVEANPATLTDPVLDILGAACVNRLSVGVQSFVDAELLTLGRMHDAQQASGALARAAGAGMTNISVDLIYGIPGQTLDSWRASLHAAIERPVEHISCYCLSFPDGTAIAADLAAGRLQAMDEDLQRDCYELTLDLLGSAGFSQYEISNFARDGRSCKHNITYWENRPYIGIGPSAASYAAGVRSTNTARIERYLNDIAAGASATCSCEQLTGPTLMAETALLALRMCNGISIQEFHDRFSVDPLEVFGGTLRRYEQLGIVTINRTRIALARQGLFVSDAVFADLLAEAETHNR